MTTDLTEDPTHIDLGLRARNVTSTATSTASAFVLGDIFVSPTPVGRN